MKTIFMQFGDYQEMVGAAKNWQETKPFPDNSFGVELLLEDHAIDMADDDFIARYVKPCISHILNDARYRRDKKVAQ